MLKTSISGVVGSSPEMLVNLDLLYRQDQHAKEWEAAFLELGAEK